MATFIEWIRGLFRAPGPRMDPVAFENHRRAAAVALPFERIETTGSEALATWERLRLEDRGWPIVVGDDEELERLAETWEDNRRTPASILAAAAGIDMPQGLRDLRAREHEAATTWRAANDPEALATIEPWDDQVFEGEWPDPPPPPTGLTTASDYKGKPHDKVNILLVPTKTSANVPAFLAWGGWNECPAPEYHVAALRYWSARYGVELVGMSGAVLNLRAARRPSTREEALILAREQLVYCEDIVSQGTETVQALAAALHADDWWYFWWD